ncbi:hypothetical protein CRYUN_Cryun10bG0155400 [Craigia yunnanensis]
MRKTGPCFHCGIDSTPLWRNGPPEKPVLCNACGSRYRLGKSLENYTPKNFQVIRKKKRKAVPKAIVTDHEETIVTSNAFYSSILEDYASSESSTSPDNWGSLWGIPSRKKSPVVYSCLTTIQKLRRDLHDILRDEDPFNNVSEGPEDDVLIYNININKLQIPSTEIGLGSILLKFPVTSQDQQEIEPCSSSICGKVSHLNHAQIASPSLANACSNEDVDGVQNENSPIVFQEDDDHPSSPTN